MTIFNSSCFALCSGYIPNRCISAGARSMYSCDSCDKSYRQVRNLRRHKKYECGGKKPQCQCPYCPHISRYKSDLKTHVYTKHMW
ncbi:longitudinals lacking protein-like [Rhodnius prolixus]|uniref:longitudinals lacking protein-like n=1 Tax=Rhodnius prolixus TaxID=13249 RepID=UPI003D18E42B